MFAVVKGELVNIADISEHSVRRKKTVIYEQLTLYWKLCLFLPKVDLARHTN